MNDDEDLFGKKPPRPTRPPVPPEVSAAAKHLRSRGVKSRVQAMDDADIGVQRSSSRAGPQWVERAEMLFEMHVRAQHPKNVLTEEVREFAKTQGLEDVSDGRAWGAIPRKLQHRGVIEQDAPRRARSSNNTFKPAWKLKA